MRLLYPIKLDREGYSISTIHRNLAKYLSNSIEIIAFKENKPTEIKNVRLISSFHNKFLDALWINTLFLFIFPKIDMIHIVPNIALLPLFFFSKIFGKKTIYTLHETVDETLKRPWLEKTVLMIFAKYSNQLTCVSEFVKESANKRNLFPTVIHNGIEEEFFVKKPVKEVIIKEFNIENKKPIALYLGALREGKGADIVVELAKKNPAINFIIVGKGALFERISKDIKEQKNIYYKAHYNYYQLNKLYSSVDVLLFPSKIDSFGLVCLESICCGTPVVAFNAAGAKEILTPGTGFLCNTISNMETALKKIVLGKFKFSNKEAELIRKKFNWRSISLDYLKVYKVLK